MTHLDPEHALNNVLQHVSVLAVPACYFYATLHFIVTPAMLIWTYRVRPAAYRNARTVLAIVTASALIGFWKFPTAPPRLLSAGGFHDTLAAYGNWGWWGSDASVPAGAAAIANQFAAMPSLHMAWAAWCGATVFRLTSQRWLRIFAVAYPALTGLVVPGTANHYLADVVAGACLWALADFGVRAPVPAAVDPAPWRGATGADRVIRFKREKYSERLRQPQPLLRSRIPSGRGAMEQPNVTGDGEAALSVRFWLALVLVGVAAGLLGAALMALLFHVEYAAFGYHSGEFESGVKAASAVRRMTSLLAAGAFGGVAWFVVRSYTQGKKAEIDDALWSRSGELSVRRSAGTSVISEIMIGMGASLGREAAPKLMGGVSGGLVGHWFGLSAPQQRLLIACGGGARLASLTRKRPLVQSQ